MAQERAGHSSGSHRTLQGASGTDRASLVADKIRHARTLESARQRRRRSAVARGRAAMRPPLFTIRCQTAMPQRHEDHGTRSMASSMVSTATVVHSRPAIGSPSGGGSRSWTCPAPSGTAGTPAALRWRGGHRVTAHERSARRASRAGCRPRRGMGRTRVLTTGWAARGAQRECGGARTHRSHAARSNSATPAGRSAARTSERAAARSPTLTPRGGGPPAWALQTASRLPSHGGLACWVMGRCLRRARVPTSWASRAQTWCAPSPQGTRAGVIAKVLWTHRPWHAVCPRGPKPVGARRLVQVTSGVSGTAHTTGTVSRRP